MENTQKNNDMEKDHVIWVIDDLKDALAMIARYDEGGTDPDDTIYKVKEKILDALDFLEDE